jgi:hypothetical protein
MTIGGQQLVAPEMEDDVLSADLVLSEKEVLVEFQERCEEATETRDRRNMAQVVEALCRMLDR